jgi:hypothetical protein
VGIGRPLRSGSPSNEGPRMGRTAYCRLVQQVPR